MNQMEDLLLIIYIHMLSVSCGEAKRREICMANPIVMCLNRENYWMENSPSCWL